MDINQNLQTNTFLKGMNSDTSDMLLGADLYRHAVNVRPITNTDNNSGELRIIEGNKALHIASDEGEILALNSIRNVGVMIVKKHDQLHDTDSWAIFRFDVDKENDRSEKVFGWCEEPIWGEGYPDGSKNKYINTVLRWESEKNIKLYIADHKHQLMSINIMDDYDPLATFLDVFQYLCTLLPAPTILVSSETGAIPGHVVQYVYRLYKENGTATTLSAMSNPLSIYKSTTQGFKKGLNTRESILINLPEIDSGTLNKVQIYRIDYIQLGLSPNVTLIYDGNYSYGTPIIDRGYFNIETISDAELLSMYTLDVVPSLLESMGDYLFLADVKYQLDEVDKEFESFDPSYIQHQLIQSSLYTITPQNNGDSNRHRTYRSGETYRFGIRFYNNKGYASSVKWIADINIEDLPNPTIDIAVTEWLNLLPYSFPKTTSVKVRDVGVKFTPNVSTESSAAFWDKVSGYEIVQCQRTLADKRTLMSGFVGHVHKCIEHVYTETEPYDQEVDTGYLTPVGFLSLEDIVGVLTSAENTSVVGSGGPSYDHLFRLDRYTANSQERFMHPLRIASPQCNVLLFISPEYVYQSDDVENAISQYKNGLSLYSNYTYEPQSRIIEDANGDQMAIDIAYEFNTGSDEDVYKGLIGKNSQNLYISFDGLELNRSNYLVSCERYSSSPVNPYAISAVGPEYYMPYDDKYQTSTHNSEMIYDPQYLINMSTFIYNKGKFLTYNNYATNYNDYAQYILNPVSDLGSNNVIHDSNTSGFSRYTTKDANGVSTHHYLNYFKPKMVYPETNPYSFNVVDVAYAKSPDFNTFASNDEFTFKDSSVAIAGKSFVNWTNPFIVAEDEPDTISDLKERIDNNYDSEQQGDFWPNTGVNVDMMNKLAAMYPIGSGGKAILFLIDDSNINTKYKNINTVNYPTIEDLFDSNNYLKYSGTKHRMPLVTIMDLKKDAEPYGGTSESAKKASKYLSVGAFKTIDHEDQNADNSIDVFAGDTYIKYFTYVASHQWWDPKYKIVSKNTTVYTAPLETDIDIQALSSDSLFGVTSDDYRVQEKASAFDKYVQLDDSYLYDTAYSIMPDVVGWYQNNKTTALTNVYDTRVHHSQLKTNNEMIDSWMQFKTADFLDVDTRYGKITALQAFKNKLLFWQENSTGILSVNERSLVKDSNSSQIILGSGGVLDRYDYITNIYGQKLNLNNQVCSDGSLYWWDGINKEILAYADGYSVLALGTAKQVKNYLNKITEANLPTLFYDLKYKEVVCAVGSTASLVYNEQVQAFTSEYTYCPEFWCNINGNIYSTKKNFSGDIYKEDTLDGTAVKLYNVVATPKVSFVVNKEPLYNKTFDLQTFGGRFYGGSNVLTLNDDDKRMIEGEHGNAPLSPLTFSYTTPLKQSSSTSGSNLITNVEYDYRLTIPRNNNDKWGGRMRGKVLCCKIESSSNDPDFSLQYINTKFRMSWT